MISAIYFYDQGGVGLLSPSLNREGGGGSFLSGRAGVGLQFGSFLNPSPQTIGFQAVSRFGEVIFNE